MWVPELACSGVGLLCQPGYRIYPWDGFPHGIPWAADTGIFGAAKFSLERYMRMLRQWADRQEDNLFATAPDVVFDWPATLKRSLPVLDAIRQLGYRAALVVQDGATPDQVPWNEIDVVFTGGSTRWKLSEDAYKIIAEAKSRGVWSHMGRVNSLRRLRAAKIAGYDSADGTYVKYGPTHNAQKVLGWMADLELQPSMYFPSVIELPNDDAR